MIQLLRFLYFCVSLVFWCYNLFMDLQITNAAQSAAAMRACILFFQILFLSFYVAISSVVILIFLFFCARPFARAISNRWPDHSLSFHYLYKYIYKNTADDMSAPWTRHRRYRFILWVFLCGSGISVSSVRIRLHCKHGSIQPDAILSRTLKGFHGHRRKFLIQS